MEKKQEFKAAAYEQIKKLGGNSTESIKTIKTDIGEMDVKVQAELDHTDFKKVGGNMHERPYVYRGYLEGVPVPVQVADKINNRVYETAEAAFNGTKAIVEKYVEGLKAVESL